MFMTALRPIGRQSGGYYPTTRQDFSQATEIKPRRQTLSRFPLPGYGKSDTDVFRASIMLN